MNSSESESWESAVSPAERVRSVALTLSEPQTANWIKNEAGVAHDTATKYLDRLVEDNRLRKVQSESTTRYYPDRVTQYLDEVRTLHEEHTADELTKGMNEVKDQIQSWKDTYDVTSPNELRMSIRHTDRPAANDRERRRVANEWEHLEHRLDLVEDALSLYDRFPQNHNYVPA